jgi:mono/diheme cytochrome c family protein
VIAGFSSHTEVCATYAGEFSMSVRKRSQSVEPPLRFRPFLERHGHCRVRLRGEFRRQTRFAGKVEAIMTIKINDLMKLGAGFAGLVLAATLLVVAIPARAGVDDFDAAGTYKAKCVACHGAKAEKKFDATLSDDDMAQVVLKGKKPEKPPNMPAFEERGITADQAKALVAYMKSIK